MAAQGTRRKIAHVVVVGLASGAEAELWQTRCGGGGWVCCLALVDDEDDDADNQAQEDLYKAPHRVGTGKHKATQKA